MTTCDIQTSGAIELLFYGELEGAERTEVERHVHACAACRQALEELALIREALDARPVVSAPPGGDWAPFMRRLQAAVRNEKRLAATSEAEERVARPRVFARRVPLSRPSYSGYLAMAALLALVTINVLFVARSRGPATPVTSSTGVPLDRAPRQYEPDPVLTTISEQHFERSKLVLLDLATRDGSQAAGWERERDLAAGLLNDTRLYRMAAEERGMTRLAGVLRDLEIVLLQTSMTDAADPAALDRIQRLIRKRDVLGQMEAVSATTTGS